VLEARNLLDATPMALDAPAVEAATARVNPSTASLTADSTPSPTGGSGGGASLSAGTWTPVTNFAPTGIGTMILSSDGTVMAQGSGTTNNWYRLTPNATGSYTNGSWSSLTAMGTQRLYFASNVLQSGKVFLVGGEYSGPSGTQNWTDTGEIYDPVANSWTPITPFPQSQFGDDPSEMLPNGNVLTGYLSGPQTYIYNPTTNSWSQAGTKLLNDRSDEESWVKLPDGSILSYDIFASPSSGAGHAQRYFPSTNKWVDAGSVPVPLSGSSFGEELGPAFLLSDGRVFQLGANGNTALYTPSTNSWVAGPTIPNGKAPDDAPGAELPNGHVIFAADTPNSKGPTQLFDFDPVANTITQFTSLPSQLTSALTQASFTQRMLVLPTGQVLFSTGGSQAWVFTPSDNPIAASAPTISSVSLNSDGTFTLTGTQLNGISEGAAYGDDAEMSSNYPIVQLADASGNVFYARTFNWSSTGVATGNTVVSTEFVVPPTLPGGQYSLVVIANGIASAPVSFTQPLSVIGSTPAAGSIVSTPPTSFTINFSAPVDPSSLQPSDLTVNSIGADNVSLSPDDTTATFTYKSSPVTTQGLETMSMAAGSVSRLGDPSANFLAFNAQFRYDAVLLQVVSTNPPSNGAILLPAPITFDVNFNEAVDPNSVQASDLVLNGLPGAFVSGVTVLSGNTTAEFTIAGVSSEGPLTVSIAAGAITDAFGNPGAAFSASYFTHFATAAMPTPLVAQAPLGSTIYETSATGYIGSKTDSDTFTLSVNPDQTIAVVVTPSDGIFQPSVRLIDPTSQILDIETAISGGFAAVVEATPTDNVAAGTYSIRISGAAGTTGFYSVQVILNATPELEGLLVGADNNTLSTAQQISDPVEGATGAASVLRGSVLGETDSGNGSASTPDYYSFSASAGETDSIAVAGLSAGNLTLELLDGNGNVLASGTSAANLSQVISPFTFSAAGQYYVEISGGANVPYSLVITSGALFDVEPNDTPAEAQSLAGMQGAVGAIATTSDADWYSISVPSASTVLRLSTSTPSDGTGQFSNVLSPQIELFDPSVNPVASGVVGADGRNESLQYRPLVSGTYTVRLTGNSGSTGEYFLSSQLSLSGDVNQDGTVNGLDIALVASDWLNTGSDPADANGDGVVNGLDIAMIASQWLQSLSSGGGGGASGTGSSSAVAAQPAQLSAPISPSGVSTIASASAAPLDLAAPLAIPTSQASTSTATVSLNATTLSQPLDEVTVSSIAASSADKTAIVRGNSTGTLDAPAISALSTAPVSFVSPSPPDRVAAFVGRVDAARSDAAIDALASLPATNRDLGPGASAASDQSDGQQFTTSSIARVALDDTALSRVDDDLLETLATGHAKIASFGRLQG
jgi:hypothetical protein